MTTLPLLIVLSLVGPHATRYEMPTVTDLDAGAALTDAQVLETVQDYLSSIDTHIPAANWKALGTRGATALSNIAQQSNVLPIKRAKAVDALTLIGGEEARTVVLSLATSDSTHKVVRAHALRGAGHLLSSTELTTNITPVLKSASEPLVRATAAEVLADHAASSACGAIRAQASAEATAIQPKFSRALSKCQVAAQ